MTSTPVGTALRMCGVHAAGQAGRPPAARGCSRRPTGNSSWPSSSRSSYSTRAEFALGVARLLKAARILAARAVDSQVLPLRNTLVTLAFTFVACVVLTFGAVTRAQPPAASGSPIVTVLRPSAFMGEYAIWGATGSNQAG